MSMIPGLDEDRWAQGMSTERYHPWYGEDLEPQPVSGAEGVAGHLSVMVLLSPEGGVSYEQTEPVAGQHHRAKASGPVPYKVRPS